jgi:hypothetical protein
MAPSSFWEWFGDVEKRAAASPIGKLLTARGFTVAHIGGGCLAWQKGEGDFYVYITSGDAELGDDLPADKIETHPFFCGLYNGDADEISFVNDVAGATAAADWCDKALAEAGQ